TTYSGVLAGTLALSKAGNSTQVLAGSDTYTGSTTVSTGTLVVNGTITGNATVTVSGTLGGSGTVSGNVIVNPGGTLSPGNSPGELNIGGDVNFSSGSTYSEQIDGDNPGNGANFYDQLEVQGNLILNNATLSATLFDEYDPTGKSFTISNLIGSGTVSGT